MEERISLFSDYDTGAFSVSDLCKRSGISRDTFYVWKRRRDSGDERWFEDQSHATLSCPHATPAGIAERLLAVRRKFPHFGPKKIRAWLSAKEPEFAWPAASTIGDILKREGLIAPRSGHKAQIPKGEMTSPAEAPNAEWAIDFKGHFRTRDGTRCDPLTLTDTYSRYLLDVRIVKPTTVEVKAALERLFCEAGLPAAMRSDNGQPFGSTGAGGLSVLAVWLLKLGIDVRYIPPGSPQDNGRHERMHRTLKAQTSAPPAGTAEEQQARFDRFRSHYNDERPHEALEQKPPSVHWRASEQRMPGTIEEPWYDANHEVRRVNVNGMIKWRGDLRFVGAALAGEPVGLAEHEGGGHIVRFCKRDLGMLMPDGYFQPFAPPRARLRAVPEASNDTGTKSE